MKKLKHGIALLLAIMMALNCFSGVVVAQEPDTTTRPTAKRTLVKDPNATQEEDPTQMLTPGLAGTNVLVIPEFRDGKQPSEDDVVTAIVLLEGKAAAETTEPTRSAKTRLAAQHNNLRGSMRNAGISYTEKFDYMTLLNGMAVSVRYGDLEKLAALDGVASVHIANQYDPPEAEVKMESSNEMTGVASLQKSGYTGSGMVIAVLDTGITPQHEAFGVYAGMLEDAAFTQDAAEAQIEALGYGAWLSEKIPFSYDYADQDDDATDDRSGHGTHVSAIAAGYAETEDGGVKFCGSAPDAQILAMKIFSSDYDGTDSSIYFAALEDAYNLGANVINMSIGAQNGFTYDSDLEDEVYGNIFQNLKDHGVAVVVAAGNEGAQGDNAVNKAGPGYVTADYLDYGTVGSPSTYAGSLSVASAENAEYPMFQIVAGDRDISYYDSTGNDFYNLLSGLDSVEFAVVPGFGTEEDFAGLMVQGRVALVSRGEITFAEKATNAMKAGAIAIVVYNNEDGLLGMALDNRNIPAVMVSQEDGAYLCSLAQTVKAPEVEPGERVDFEESSYLDDDCRALIVFSEYDKAIATSVQDGRLQTRPVEIGERFVEDYWEGWVSYRAITADPSVLSWSSEFDEDYNRYLRTDAGTYLTVTEDGSLALTEEPVTAWGIYRWRPDEEDAEPYPGYVIAPVDGDSEPSRFLRYYDAGVKLFPMYEGEIYYYLFDFYNESYNEPPAPPVDTDIGSLRISDEPVIVESEEAWLMSSFSSMGPTPDLQFKPQITAVGGNVYAASFLTESGYELMSGTSMATPDMSGCVATMMQYIQENHPEVEQKHRAELAVALLESSAQLLTDDNDAVYSVRKQGAGLIDLEAATNIKAYITEPLLAPGASENGVYELCFTVKSLGEAVTYQIKTKALTDKLAQMDTGLYNTMEAEALTAEDFTVITNAENDVITVPAGQSVDVTVTIALSDAAKARFDETFPNGNYIDGFVELQELVPVSALPTGDFRFKDVKKSAYYFTPVYWAVNHEPQITAGTGPDTFSPNAVCTRAQNVTFLWGAMGRPTPKTTENPFTDVRSKAYYKDAVLWAYENHITGGTSATTFSPDAPCTRAQTVTFLWAAMDKPAPKTTENPFADVSKKAYYRDAVLWAYENHITGGTSATTFSPNAPCTRSQIVTFLFGAFTTPDTLVPDKSASTIHASFLGFYGDWSKAPIAEQTDWRDVIDAIHEAMETEEDYLSLTDKETNTGVNMAYTANYMVLSVFGALLGTYAGDNLLGTVDYNDAHIAISTDGTFDCLYLEPHLLRNARRVIMTVSYAESGEFVYAEVKEYVPKAIFDEESGNWYGSTAFLCNNPGLPSGTKLRVDLYASLDYGEDVLGSIEPENLAQQAAQYRFWSVPLRIDNEMPTLDNISYDPNTKKLTVTVTDDQYLMGVRLAQDVDGVDEYGEPAKVTNILDDVAWSDSEEGLSHTVVFEDVAVGEEYTLCVMDYAGNEVDTLLIPGEGEFAHVDFHCMDNTHPDNGVKQLLVAKGQQMTLPGVSFMFDGDTEFIGWLTHPIDGTMSEEAMADLEEAPMPAAERYTINGDTTLYAVYRNPVSDPYYMLHTVQREYRQWDGVYAFSGHDSENPEKRLFLNGQLEAVELETTADPESGEILLANATDAILFDVEEQLIPEGGGWYHVVYSFRNRQTGAYLSFEDCVLSAKDELDDSCMWNISYNEEDFVWTTDPYFEMCVVYDSTKGAFTVTTNVECDFDNSTFTFWNPKPYSFEFFTDLPE